MRTNIDIDQHLLDQAMALTGLETKRAAVEEALRRLIQTHHRKLALTRLRAWGGMVISTQCAKGDRTLDRRRQLRMDRPLSQL